VVVAKTLMIIPRKRRKVIMFTTSTDTYESKIHHVSHKRCVGSKMCAVDSLCNRRYLVDSENKNKGCINK
jgi:hypothetical protein